MEQRQQHRHFHWNVHCFSHLRWKIVELIKHLDRSNNGQYKTTTRVCIHLHFLTRRYFWWHFGWNVQKYVKSLHKPKNGLGVVIPLIPSKMTTTTTSTENALRVFMRWRNKLLQFYNEPSVFFPVINWMYPGMCRIAHSSYIYILWYGVWCVGFMDDAYIKNDIHLHAAAVAATAFVDFNDYYYFLWFACVCLGRMDGWLI